MTRQNQLALIVAFYLSKFDREALNAMGYQTFNAAFDGISSLLDVNRNTIKNMRDEYDPLHPNKRRGWYQRPLEEKPSRVYVAQMFDNLDFLGFTSFVRALLSDEIYRSSEEVQRVMDSLVTEDRSSQPSFTPRGPTGRKAENLFIKLFNAGELPVSGHLTNRRDDGCGYDFEVQSGSSQYHVEVKGLAGMGGGISLTEKEWDKCRHLERYCMFLAYNLDYSPLWTWIDHPQMLDPKCRVATVVQLSWYVSPNQVQSLIQSTPPELP